MKDIFNQMRLYVKKNAYLCKQSANTRNINIQYNLYA